MNQLNGFKKNMVVMIIITVFVTVAGEYFIIPGIITLVLVIIGNGIWLFLSPFKLNNDV